MYEIQDWTGAKPFGEAQFETFDDAEDYLSEVLDETYEEGRGEFYILPVKSVEEGQYD